MQIRLFNNNVRLLVVLLALAEAALLAMSISVASGILTSSGDLGIGRLFTSDVAQSVAVVVAVLIVTFLAVGLYQFNQRVTAKDIIARLIVSYAIGWLCVASVFFFVRGVQLPRTVLVLAALISFIAILCIRLLFLGTVDQNMFRRRTLIFGAGESAMNIANLRRASDRRGFKVVGYVQSGNDSEPELTVKEPNARVIQHDRQLLEIAQARQADEIVIAIEDRRGKLPVDELVECKMRGMEVLDLVGFLERETGKIRIDMLRPGWLAFSDGFSVNGVRLVVKRILDLTVSVIALVFLWPVMLLTALAIWFTEGFDKPVFYRQVRIGLFGEEFNVLKFRSMRTDAEADGKAQWAKEDDDRITRVGRFIRKTRIDELPQLLNVLTGSMSLVGPRPERPVFVEELSRSIPYYGERHSVKPGITGWAQLRYPYGSSHEDAIEKLQYDLYYIKNQNVLFDLIILLQTAEVILWGKGAR